VPEAHARANPANTTAFMPPLNPQEDCRMNVYT
jgi:hypothetical protein